MMVVMMLRMVMTEEGIFLNKHGYLSHRKLFNFKQMISYNFTVPEQRHLQDPLNIYIEAIC